MPRTSDKPPVRRVTNLNDSTLNWEWLHEKVDDFTAGATLDYGEVGDYSTIEPDDAASAGAATEVASADHQHAITCATASTLTGTNAEGTATSFARSDHNHAFPNWGTVYGDDLTVAAATGQPSVSNRLYLNSVQILCACTLTGLRFRAANSTGNVRAALYDSGGTRVANRTTNLALANTVQNIAFDATYAAVPSVYYMGIIFDGTLNSFYNASARLANASVQTEASFVTPASITVPTTFMTSASPVLCTY